MARSGTPSECGTNACVTASPAALTIACAIAWRGAHAEPAPVTPIALEYVAPAACPDEISLRAGVVARLGQDPFRGDAPRKALIDVEPTAAGFVAAIELREAGGRVSRRAVGPAAKCEDAVAALELALAVIIDPTTGASAGDPTPITTTTIPSPNAPVPAYGPPVYEPPGWRTPPTPAGPRVHELALIIGLVAGAHPESEGYFGVRAGYRLAPHWRIGMFGRVAEGSGTLDPERTYETRTSELAVEGCWRREFVLACGFVGAGSKSVQVHRYTTSSGYEDVADYSDPYGLVGASLALEVPLGNAFLRPMIESAAPLPQVHVESEGVRRWDLPRAQLAFDLAIGYRW